MAGKEAPGIWGAPLMARAMFLRSATLSMVSWLTQALIHQPTPPPLVSMVGRRLRLVPIFLPWIRGAQMLKTHAAATRTVRRPHPCV
jgi:hypothetical protein